MSTPLPITRLRNLTGHPLHLVLDDAATSSTVDLPPHGPPARCVSEPDRPAPPLRVGDRLVPLFSHALTSVVAGLPAPEPATVLVVSRLVATALPERRDLVFPLHPVRDHTGRTTGCRALAQVPSPCPSETDGKPEPRPKRGRP